MPITSVASYARAFKAENNLHHAAGNYEKSVEDYHSMRKSIIHFHEPHFYCSQAEILPDTENNFMLYCLYCK
ncbi:hypothetical protein CBX57_010320 [Salmonella enterica]|nr:hypothetical protein [Salmonella enterica]